MLSLNQSIVALWLHLLISLLYLIDVYKLLILLCSDVIKTLIDGDIVKNGNVSTFCSY